MLNGTQVDYDQCNLTKTNMKQYNTAVCATGLAAFGRYACKGKSLL